MTFDIVQIGFFWSSTQFLEPNVFDAVLTKKSLHPLHVELWREPRGWHRSNICKHFNLVLLKQSQEAFDGLIGMSNREKHDVILAKTEKIREFKRP